MAELVAQLALIHEAGASHLPTAAGCYETSRTDVAGVYAPAGETYWSAANSAAASILKDAGQNISDAGDVLRLLAWELAERDGVTSRLLTRTGLKEIPELGRDGWSDGS
ncbi:hypothetical protein LX16_4249 [Stackebrandtia albiflava]|uniref:Uncharacterized protein n=1 Tax=Stackebrandtia albiflava TaxID=406432 RepID=A0A562UYY8_9ACTN|nr:hypothetical protein [Stackebrandtia albiflava]TWJ10825.1 hypothetical protein LX16_4249 [Stackebrandtia albiflava]